MTENQKLREAFSRIRSLITDTTRIDSHTISLVRVECNEALTILDSSMNLDQEIDAIAFNSISALALPTAAPVGERELPPVIAYRLDYPASEGVGLPRFFGADDGERAHTFAFNHKATITELCDRAALSAGDAVDAQRYRLVRRGQHFSIINGIGDTLRGEALDAAADAAMRKGQL